MNISELRDALRSRGIDPASLHVNDTSKLSGYHFVEGYGRWTVFTQNTTGRDFEKSFFDEEAACRYLLRLAVNAGK